MAQKELTDYAEIQQMEIDALKSIFMEDFEEEEIKAAAWNRKAERRFRLRLNPFSGSTGDTELYTVLAVALPTTYPKQTPICEVEFGASVSKRMRTAIKKLVPERAKALVGTEAIYEIAVTIQEQLDEALTALAHTESLPALDVERVKRQAEVALEEEKARDAQLKAQQQAQTQDENARSAAIGKLVQKSVPRTMVPTTLSNSITAPDGPDIVVFDTEMKVRAPSGIIVAFRTIRVSPLTIHGPVTRITTTWPADHTIVSELPTLALKMCEVGKGWTENELKAELSNTLEADLQALMKLPVHRNILPVLGFRIQATSGTTMNRTWNVSVLNEFIKGGSLRDLVGAAGRLEANIFRSYIMQILEGMEYLHSHQIPHGRLTLENVLLEKGPKGDVVVKITDILFQADLHFLENPTKSTFSAAMSTYWQPPEFASTAVFRPTVPADMWQLGILILQMLFGIDVQSQHSAPLQMKDDKPLNSQLENLIERIFKSDPNRRPTCFDTRAHAFLREDHPTLDPADPPFLSPVSPEGVSFTPKVPRARLGSHGTALAAREKNESRYASDFSEIVRLGKGGFGQVFKARNRLDGQTYAVKKVVSESNETLHNVLGEVTLLSRLYHPNIVRYVTAWIDKAKIDKFSAQESSDDESGVEYSLSVDDSNVLSRSKQPRSRGLDFISSKRGIGTDDETESDSDTCSESDSEDFSAGDKSEDGKDIVFGEDTDDGKNSSSDSNKDHVVFGEDTDPGHKHTRGSSTPATPQMDSAAAARHRRRSSNHDEGPQKVTLYIQMEFCENQTLRDIIRGDISNSPDDYWRFLRQISGALQYVHANGIIHRDMKPENIFVSGTSIRLGDFGLAKPHVKRGQRGRSTKNIAALTASIGTFTYIAPEVRSSGGGTYDEKADMYSLGIIFFEMCYSPRATGMERVAIVNDLRKEATVFPDDFEQSDKTLERELVRNLLQHKPADRLSAADLLVKLPSEADDEALNQRITAAFADENDPTYRKFIKQSFDRPFDSREPKHYTYDIAQTQHYTNAGEAYLLTLVKDQLIEVFRSHCAVESTRQQLIPNNEYWTEAVRVLDESGQVLHLPYDLTLPGARLLAKNGKIAPCKAYSIAPVFRRNASPGQHPITSIEIDFDIISKDSLNPALREAEALQVMDEIIDAVPALSAMQMCFHVNHCDLLDAILRACKIPPGKMRQVQDVVSRLGHKQFAQVRMELRAPEIGISSTSLDDLARYDFRDSPNSAIARLKELLDRTESLEPTFSHILAFVNWAKLNGIRRKIYLSPLSCHSAHFYSGSLMFQCLFDGRKRKTVVCAGGRYDRLIREHASDRSVPPCFAVGFQLSWESLVTALRKYRSNVNKGKSKSKDDSLTMSRRGDVLVGSNDDETMLKECVAVANDLRANGIRCELAVDAEGVDSLGYSNTESSHYWLVYVKQEGMVRVRSMVRNDEDELPRPELLSYLRSKIRERDHERNKTLDRPRLPHTVSDATHDSSSPKVKVLWAQTRSKKTNRQVIISEAHRYANELRHRDGQIVAVELKDESFEMIRGVRLDDTEGWRRVAQYADLNARQYISQLRDELVGIATASDGEGETAILFNFRSKACMFYDLTRSI